MIRKISIYGVCFNWAVAFGIVLPSLTQEDFSLFSEAHKEDMLVETGKIIETSEKDGDIEIPANITLQSEALWEDFKKFSNEHRFLRDTQVTETSQESTEAETVETSSKGSSVEPIEPFTAEEVIARFEKFSRPMTPAELEDLGEHKELCGVNLRVVDFDSILYGLDRDEKTQVLKLMNDEDALLEVIKAKIDNKDFIKPSVLVWLSLPNGNGNNMLSLKLEESIIQRFKNLLEITLKKMAEYKSSRETLVLSLVLLQDLEFCVTTSTPYCGKKNSIFFHFYKNESSNVQALYHELNHALHAHLGIKPCYFQNVGDFNTIFEEGFFRFSALLNKMLDEDKRKPSIEVPKGIVKFLLHNADVSEKDSKIMNVPAEKLYKIAQISLFWDGLEELWNIIGFANIRNCIFFNRLSDLNLVKRPGLFHQRERHQYKAFTDFSTTPEGLIRLFLEGRVSFLKEVEACTKSENVGSVCPTSLAWRTWLKLQNRSDAEAYGYFTMIDKTAEELVKTESETMELVGSLPPLQKL